MDNLNKVNELNLKFIENQTETICLVAVRNDGFALKFVQNQTEKICLEAIIQYESILQYIDNKIKEDIDFWLKVFRIKANIKLPKKIKENDLFWFKLVQFDKSYIKYVPKYLKKIY